jgi:iron complex transport system ATP-binding protein
MNGKSVSFASDPASLELRGVTAGYGAKIILRDFDLSFHSGDFCALLGPNGCGKSTLLKTIVGALPLLQGSISINGKSGYRPRELARIITLIPQETVYQFDFTVEDIVLSGQFPYLRFGQDYHDCHREVADQAIAEFALESQRHTPISQLSGGEKQRVLLARAWAQNTPIVLMDETFANLDLNYQIEAMQKLAERNRKHGHTVVVVSHNINLVSQYCDRIILVKEGAVIADGSPDSVITEAGFHELFGASIIRIQHPQSGRPVLLYPTAP